MGRRVQRPGRDVAGAPGRRRRRLRPPYGIQPRAATPARRRRRVGPWLVSPLPRFSVARRWPERVIPVGNAAAALEPIGGEGMGLALRSAELAAAALAEAIRDRGGDGGNRTRSRLARAYNALGAPAGPRAGRRRWSPPPAGPHMWPPRCCGTTTGWGRGRWGGSGRGEGAGHAAGSSPSRPLRLVVSFRCRGREIAAQLAARDRLRKHLAAQKTYSPAPARHGQAPRGDLGTAPQLAQRVRPIPAPQLQSPIDPDASLASAPGHPGAPCPGTPRGSLFDALRRHAVPFVVIGGHAVNLHGYRRATEDTDVVWLRSPEAERALLPALIEVDARYIGKDIDPATGIERTYPVSLPFIRANRLMMLWTKH